LIGMTTVVSVVGRFATITNMVTREGHPLKRTKPRQFSTPLREVRHVLA
jgi:hypothetical protein